MPNRIQRNAAAVALSLLLSACNSAAPEPAATERSSNDWLLSADSDAERFRLLQKQLRGFDQPMWETGERFQRVHDALERGNYELAGYHWDKIKTTIENGVAKRPARRENAEAFLMADVWNDVSADFASSDPERAWAAFERAKAACQGCHQAEGVEYMNNQPLFDLERTSMGADE